MTFKTGVFKLKKLIQLALLVALTMGFSSHSQAALLIEPVVGFNLGTKYDLKFDSFPVLNDSFSGGSGVSYGGRLGYQQLGLQLGLDYLKSSIDMNTSDLKENISTSEWGGFIGYEFPILLRVYAGYIFSGTGTTKDDGTKIEFNEGTGSKVGVGFTGLPFVDINLEYRQMKYPEMTLGSTDTDTDTTYSTIMLGLSLPFTI